MSPIFRMFIVNVLMIAPQPFFQPRGTPFSVLHRLRALTKLGHKIDLVTYPVGENVKNRRCNNFSYHKASFC